MSLSNTDLVIGVDGGGTKTVAWVAPRDDDSNTVVLGRGLSGPGNPRAVGFEAAQHSIQEAIAQALADAGRTADSVAATCFGLAGAGRELEQTRITQWALETRLAERVRVTGDAEPILAAGSTDHCGIALISGTGSLAWGRNASGEIAKTGGWGYLIGDEGSAYWIAIEALRAAVQAADQRSPQTELLPALMRELGVTAPPQLIEIIYDPGMTRDRIASLAKIVFEHASDPVVLELTTRGAGELARMVVALSHKLELKAGYSLALAGSLLLNQPQFAEELLRELTLRGANPGHVTYVAEPVRGAVALARRMAGLVQ